LVTSILTVLKLHSCHVDSSNETFGSGNTACHKDTVRKLQTAHSELQIHLGRITP
jgi:hypothetical protein